MDVGKSVLAVVFTWKYRLQNVLILQKSFAGSAVVAVPIKLGEEKADK